MTTKKTELLLSMAFHYCHRLVVNKKLKIRSTHFIQTSRPAFITFTTCTTNQVNLSFTMKQIVTALALFTASMQLVTGMQNLDLKYPFSNYLDNGTFKLHWDFDMK